MTKQGIGWLPVIPTVEKAEAEVFNLEPSFGYIGSPYFKIKMIKDWDCSIVWSPCTQPSVCMHADAHVHIQSWLLLKVSGKSDSFGKWGLHEEFTWKHWTRKRYWSWVDSFASLLVGYRDWEFVSEDKLVENLCWKQGRDSKGKLKIQY